MVVWMWMVAVIGDERCAFIEQGEQQPTPLTIKGVELFLTPMGTSHVGRPTKGSKAWSRLTLASIAAAQLQASMMRSTFPPQTTVAWPMRRQREPVLREMDTR